MTERGRTNQPPFSRKVITLGPARAETNPTHTISLPQHLDACTALVINSSHEMAKEISLELSLRMPNCSIMFAPTLGIARWILARRSIDLVVSSAVLPDGSITNLLPQLEQMEKAPDLIVVGQLGVKAAERLANSSYAFRSLNRVGQNERPAPVRERVKQLGADLRNDLNNPLQEIVAMIFVAQASGEVSPAAVQALGAIDRAAKAMATVVKGLEDKISTAVAG